MSLLLGIDLNISSVDICILDSETGHTIITARYPEGEDGEKPSAGLWWKYLCFAISDANASDLYDPDDILAIGVASQLPGFFLLDKNNALQKKAHIQSHVLREIKEKEPKKYSEIDKILMPADFIAWKLTGEIGTIPRPDHLISTDSGFDKKFMPPIRNCFDIHGYLKSSMVEKFGFGRGVPVSYKAPTPFELNATNAAAGAAIGAGIGAHILKEVNGGQQNGKCVFSR